VPKDALVVPRNEAKTALPKGQLEAVGCWIYYSLTVKLVAKIKYANNLFGLFLFGYTYRNYCIEEVGA
jgi:hypothetical protein